MRQRDAWRAGFIVAMMALALPAWGANKIYVTPESAITFGDSAQSPSATITLANLATVTGRVSAQFDRGTGAHAACYAWRFTSSLSGTNVVGATIDLYIATSDGTNTDGQVSTSDSALAGSNVLLALQRLGSLAVTQTTTNTNMTSSGDFFCTASRFLSLVVYNATTLSMQNSTSVHKFVLTPVPLEIQ